MAQLNEMLQTAHIYFKQNNFSNAWDICSNILSKYPNQPDCLAMIGMMFNKTQQYEKAIPYLEKCIIVHPQKHVILTELATSLLHLDSDERAKELLAESLNIAPNYEKTIIQFSILHKKNGKLIQSEILLKELILRNPKSESALNNLGNLYSIQHRYGEAKEIYLKALTINPTSSIINFHLGEIELYLKNETTAIAHFSTSIRINPKQVDAYFQLSSLYLRQNKLHDAHLLLQQSLIQNPNSVELHQLLGQVFLKNQSILNAHAAFEKVLELDPHDITSLSILAKIELDLCRWDNRNHIQNRLIEEISTKVETSSRFEVSLYNIAYYDIPDKLQFEVALQNGRNYRQQIKDITTTFQHNHRLNDRLKIGYISADFRMHAVGMITYQLFQYHNRSEFEIYAYSLHEPIENDYINQKIRNDVDHYFEIEELTALESATLINSHSIDILVDLSGYTTFAKPEIMFLKPAPIQVLHIGQTFTSGDSCYEYYFADKVLVDSENRKYYTENIVFLPHAFPGSALKVSENKVSREEVGIPNDAFVFCSFGGTYKYDPVMFSAWMAILNRVPKSVLWLMSMPNDEFTQNIYHYANANGVDSSRIFFANMVENELHQTRFDLCDLFLDTQFYASGSTAICSLLMGVPVLTLKGKTNAQRLGAMVCSAANLPETICDSISSYIEKAVELAETPKLLSTLKNRLTKDKESLPLFNIKQYVIDIEQSYHLMWSDLQNDSIKKDIIIETSKND